MLSGRVMLVSCQRHCNSLNPRPNRCGGGNDRGSDTSNLPNPYSEAREHLPGVAQALARDPDRPRRHVRHHRHGPAGAQELRQRGGRYHLAHDRIGDREGGAGHALHKRADLDAGAPYIGGDDLLGERSPDGVEIDVSLYRLDIPRFKRPYENVEIIQRPSYVAEPHQSKDN